MAFYTGLLEAEKRKQVLAEAIKIISDPKKWPPDGEAGRVRFDYDPRNPIQNAVGIAINEGLLSIVGSAQWMLVDNPKYTDATERPVPIDPDDERVADEFRQVMPRQLHNAHDYVSHGGTPTKKHIIVNRHVLEGARNMLSTLERMGLDVIPTE